MHQPTEYNKVLTIKKTSKKFDMIEDNSDQVNFQSPMKLEHLKSKIADLKQCIPKPVSLKTYIKPRILFDQLSSTNPLNQVNSNALGSFDLHQHFPLQLLPPKIPPAYRLSRDQNVTSPNTGNSHNMIEHQLTKVPTRSTHHFHPTNNPRKLRIIQALDRNASCSSSLSQFSKNNGTTGTAGGRGSTMSNNGGGRLKE